MADSLHHRGKIFLILFLLLLSTIVFSPLAIAKIAPETTTKQALNASITVNTKDAGQPIDIAKLLGTNVPAWLGSDRFHDPVLQQRVMASGSTLMRVPGGSWANTYDWLACERGWGIDQTAVCAHPWAAIPSDFIELATKTNQSIIYTVNFNGTSKEAAALVAFFNGDPTDNRSIGFDVRGRDWGTVGQWAKFRQDQGYPDPVNVILWEIGNEIYGGKHSSNPNCRVWGWEEVWTCAGKDYAYGAGRGKDRREGFIEFQRAMKFVDPTIQVGAVGLPFPKHWNDWGNEVIATTGSEMDFYAIHDFAYFLPPETYEDVLAYPQRLWKIITDDIDSSFNTHANYRRVPLAVTEYNMFADQSKDPDRWMTRAVNALFVADSIGQMATHGVEIANYWSLASNNHANGTSFGLINENTYRRAPQYYVFPLWSQFGNTLLPVANSLSADNELSVYAGRVDSNTFSVLAINKMGRSITADIHLNGAGHVISGQISSLRAISLDSKRVIYNGINEPVNDLSNAPAQQIKRLNTYTFPPYSVTLLELDVRTFRR